MNNRFFIKNLGEFKFLAPVITVDYPVTFVAKRKCDNIELFIFDEVASDDFVTQWVMCQISVDDLDDLNSGRLTLNQCFLGPRKTAKQGYLVTSKAGQEEAECEVIADISPFVSDQDCYVEPFVPDDHGCSIRSLATEKHIIACILDQSKYADPFLAISELERSNDAYKSFLKSMPYCIDKKIRCSQSASHSLVFYYEVSDKQFNQQNSNHQLRIEELSDDKEQLESSEVIKVMETVLNEKSNSAEILGALGNNKESLNKLDKFMDAMAKGRQGKQTIQVAYAKEGMRKTFDFSEEKVKQVRTNTKETIRKIEESVKKEHIFHSIGRFEMYKTGSIAFRFCDRISGQRYRGVASKEFSSKEKPVVLQDENALYDVTLRQVYYDIDGGKSKTSYELIDFKQLSEPKQGSFI